MKLLLAFLTMFSAIVSYAGPVTLEKLTVDRDKQSICGITLGMSMEQVQKILNDQNIDFEYGQKFDRETRTMVQNKSVLMMFARDDRLYFSVAFQDDKVSVIEIYFGSFYPDSASQNFAAKLWEPIQGTSIEVIGSTIQISKD